MSVRRMNVVAMSFFAALMVALVGTPSASALNGGVPTPTVTGPIEATPDSYPFLATDIDLDRYGYVEEEFFVEGDAFRYDTGGAIDQTATRIDTGGAEDDGRYPFRTRIVVRRPADPARANGVVVAEWNNVTAGRDVEWNWFGDPEFLLRNGYTFVGVTAQNVGIAGLKVKGASRYGSLEGRWDTNMPINLLGANNGALDDLSYDIYGAALKAIRGAGDGEDPLGGIVAEKVIASGESQSCGRLATHHNKIEPLHNIVDAYLLTVCGSALRTDRSDDKVVRVLTETENRTERPTSSFPDTDSIRHWEVAGSSHLPRMAWDNAATLINRDYLPLTVSCTKFPLSLVQWPLTVNRAIAGLVDWTESETAKPPVAPRGQYLDGVLERDELGIARGGIRYPELDVPTAVNDGVNSPPASGATLFSGFCGLLGSSTGLDQETLDERYDNHADYVEQYSQAADDFLETDFILPEDVERLKQMARQFPRLRPAPPAPDRGWSSGMFKVTLSGSTAPDTTFELQRRPVGREDSAWVDIPGRATGLRPTIAGQPEGSWQYRVRSETIIPPNNIQPEQTVTTGWSDPGTAIARVDRTGPKIDVKCPKKVRSGRKVTCRVKVTDRLSGVRGPVKRAVQQRAKRRGLLKIKVKASDRVGNRTTKVAKVRVS